MANLIPEDQYTVERSWHQEGENYFPCITIAFKEKRGDTYRWPRILSDRGGHRSLDAAQKAADQLKVEGVYENGVVKFLSPSN
jgi:hypothetical protein